MTLHQVLAVDESQQTGFLNDEIFCCSDCGFVRLFRQVHQFEREELFVISTLNEEHFAENAASERRLKIIDPTRVVSLDGQGGVYLALNLVKWSQTLYVLLFGAEHIVKTDEGLIDLPGGLVLGHGNFCGSVNQVMPLDLFGLLIDDLHLDHHIFCRISFVLEDELTMVAVIVRVWVLVVLVLDKAIVRTEVEIAAANYRPFC